MKEKESFLSQPLRARRDYDSSIPDYDAHGKEKKEKESCDCDNSCGEDCSCR